MERAPGDLSIEPALAVVIAAGLPDNFITVESFDARANRSDRKNLQASLI